NRRHPSAAPCAARSPCPVSSFTHPGAAPPPSLILGVSRSIIFECCRHCKRLDIESLTTSWCWEEPERLRRGPVWKSTSVVVVDRRPDLIREIIDVGIDIDWMSSHVLVLVEQS